MELVARTTALRPIAFGRRAGFVVRVFSLSPRNSQIRVLGSEGILTRSTIKPHRSFYWSALMPAYSFQKKYRSERKGRRSFDTAIEYGTATMMAMEMTRTAKSAVRATR